MPKIIPIKDLKNTAEISEMCHSRNEPVYITKNGYGDLVIMSVETYERNFFMTEVYDKLAEAEKAVAEGRTVDAKEALARLMKKHGLQS